MSKIISIFFFAVHVAPFFFTRSSHTLLSWLFVVFITVAYFLGWYLARNSINHQKKNVFSFTECRKYSLFVIATAYFAIRVPYINEIFQALVSGDFATYALNRAKARYSGESMGVVYNIGTALFICFFGLTGTFFGIHHQNLFRALDRNKTRNSLILLVSTIFVMMLIESSGLARAGVVMALTLFFVNYLYAKRIDFKRIAFKKLILLGSKVGIFLLFVFYFSAYLRLSEGADVTALLKEKTYVYFIGPHESFSTWLSDSQEALFTTYGYNTFTSFFKLLGMTSQQGHYEKFVASQTNVFLLYRGLLQDFGPVLTGVFLVGLSYLANYSDSYSHRLPGFVIVVKGAVCMLLYLFISPFIFTTFLIGFVLSNLLQKTIYQRVSFAC